MDIITFRKILDPYYDGVTNRNWKKTDSMLVYENEYIKLLRVDSSNHHIDNGKMSKMWSLIVKIKKDFRRLPHYCDLTRYYDIRVTPVRSGEMEGYYGIRLYDLKKDPNPLIVKTLLDFIFEEQY